MAIDNKDKKVLNVPPLRFPEFSGEWEEHTLSEYLEFKNGLNPDAKRIGQGLPFISVMDILAEGVITYNSIRGKVEATDKEIDCFGVKNGDLLFQRSSETLEDVGRANVYMDSRTAVYGGFVIRGRKIGNYVPLFFKYLLATPLARKKTCRMGAGAQHFNIGQEGLSKISLSFPSVKEQEKIANLLSLIDERIATQNKIIEDLKKLKSAIYQNLFFHLQGDKVPLSELAEIIKGQQINGSELSENGKYYVMNGGITPSGYYDNYNTEADTISISEGGNSCGYVQYNSSDFWSGGHCYTLRIKPTALISTPFLFHFLKWKEPDIMALRSGSGLPNIQKKDLSKVCIIVPTLDEQQQLIALLSTFQMKIENEEIFTSNLNKQKQHLLSQMFI